MTVARALRLAVPPASLLAFGLAGCGIDSPNAPDQDSESGFILIEGDQDWSTNSVSWMGPTGGAIHFAFISVSLQASTDGPSHFLYGAPFSSGGCRAEECFPEAAAELFVQPRFTISDLDWSPGPSLAVFEGKMENESLGIYTLQPGGDPRRWITGLEPAFTSDGQRVVYVTTGRDAIRAFGLGGGNSSEREALRGAAHPRVSPDSSSIAYSGEDANGDRRIFVHDRDNPTFLADTISDPDRLPGGRPPRDGTDDDYPAWSPRGTYIAFRARIRENTVRDGIFIASNLGGEPEGIVRIAAITPGRQMSYLRWHESGQYLFVIIDGDLYVFEVPERYRDRG